MNLMTGKLIYVCCHFRDFLLNYSGATFRKNKNFNRRHTCADKTTQNDDMVWLLAGATLRRALSDDLSESSQLGLEEQLTNQKPIATLPIWTAYNSLLTKARPVTRVSAPPEFADPAHE